MGLPIEADKSLILAIKALKNNRGVVHWEITEKLYSGKIERDLIDKKIKSIVSSIENSITYTISEIRIIRWLSPRVAHIAVDLEIS